MKSKEYFKFVVSRTENDLKKYSSSSELLKCMYLLGVLKNSDNLLKDIYTISRIKNFKTLGNYLLFVLKKTETGEIKFDNLLENLTLDKEYILGELLDRFDIDSPPDTDAVKEILKTEDEKKDDKISGEIKRILAESKFKVEEIDNELVTEEFIESNVKEDDELIVRGNYLELLQPEGGFEEESVFSLPTDKAKVDAEEENNFLENDVFSLPGEKTEEKIPEEEMVHEPVNTEELEEIKLDKVVDESPAEPEEIPEETIEEKEDIVEEIKEEIPEIMQEEAETTEEIEFKELIPEVNDAEIPQEEIPEEEIPPQKEEHVKETKIEEIIKEEPVEEEKIPEQIPEEVLETADVENSVYMQYETELLSRNELLCRDFNDLKELNPDDEDFEDSRELLLDEIVENSAYLEDYSRKMSFEVITSIYNVINMTFASYGKTVGVEIIALFKKSINLVESLIKGEDFAGFDNVIKSLETLKNTLIDSKKDEVREEEMVSQDKDELEFPLSSKTLDTNQRQKLVLVKQNILEVENVFKSLEEIKGKFQAYEALRRLSHTFAHFKEIVNTANALDMRKLAQLAEASYIFVKFVQNYRMNPFESEISEVFKYIIYNFKLIFLDKPTKDIDLLISYLNDPVKIFEKKEKL